MIKKDRLFCLGLLTVGLFLAGCASAGSPINGKPVPMHTKAAKLHKKDVAAFIELINTGNIESLVKGLRTPFLLDSEPVLIKKDLEIFWTGYLENGFTLEGAEIMEILPLSEEDSRVIGESMEIRVFFKKYLAESSYIVNIRAGARHHLFILTPPVDGLSEILGYKGPGL